MEKAIKNLKGFMYAFILFFILTLVASVIIKLTPMPEAWSNYYVIVALCISCMFLGIYAGSYMKKRGIIYGALYSVIFLLIIIVIYMTAFAAQVPTGMSLLKYIICMLFGSVGGMIGVNLKI